MPLFSFMTVWYYFKIWNYEFEKDAWISLSPHTFFCGSKVGKLVRSSSSSNCVIPANNVISLLCLFASSCKFSLPLIYPISKFLSFLIPIQSSVNSFPLIVKTSSSNLSPFHTYLFPITILITRPGFSFHLNRHLLQITNPRKFMPSHHRLCKVFVAGLYNCLDLELGFICC